ncbi:ATP-binding protein [Opitutus sp. ER46]|uniref:ATP-binding protein n=1 Tax=Opitutus sp. ER46 TaxID=2161864 RepID=UPI000D3133CA|nr:ATP-binding protein [Opitutus sp. ER46]PTX91663.1 sensor histidine kinase [Opitutus sp. ER46]
MPRGYLNAFARDWSSRRREAGRALPSSRRSTPLRALAAALLVASALAAAPTPAPIRGLPLTRFYPFEEIGNVSRGAKLGFDGFGRLAVIHQGTYAVLNDATWVDLAEPAPAGIAMLNVVTGPDGRSYYGALGSWGVMEPTRRATLRPRPLVPAHYPRWVLATNFSDIVSTRSGVYFAGWNGVVHLDPATGVHAFIEVPGITKMFALGEQVYVSSQNHEIQHLDLATQTARGVPGTRLDGVSIDHAVEFDDGRVLFSTFDGRISVFDGTTMTPWATQLVNGDGERVSALCRLEDGGVAIAINGRGLYLTTPDGEITTSLTSPEYHRITDLATHEAGVLWIASEGGVEKLLYGTAVSLFGQRVGLPISWPQVVQWNDRVMVASSGRLYEAIPGPPGGASRFQATRNQPAAGAWAIAAQGPHLLIGNARGVFAVESDGRFTPIITPMEVARLVMVEPDLCYAIGMVEIAVLRRVDGRWTESGPRLPGVGYPSVVHRAGTSIWIELGPNRVARLSLHDGRPRAQVIEQFPWADPRWINIGVVGRIVVLSAPPIGRVYFNEDTEAICDAPPELERLLEQAPHWIARLQADDNGTLWASHERGLFTITREGERYRFDTTSFDIVNDRIPFVQLLPEGEVWISSGQSLYHVDRRTGPDTRRAFRPVLTTVVGGRSHRELARGPGSFQGLRSLPYAENSLSFRFFAGSYASRRPPVYEYRLNQADDNWTPLSNGSVLNFPELREGRYHLDVRLTDNHGPMGAPIAFDFTILPPWYRTWYAYALYALGATIAVLALVRWSIRRTHARNIVLERLVQHRTDELRAAMQKLNEETRNAATLAERGRLAGEIHDSLQQGLSGLMLQLDATLKLPGLTADVRSRLSVARNMVSFTRHEVQHAVWNMESPLLEGTELGQALRKLTELINPGSAQVEVRVTGEPVPLTPATKHHLLRIGQEAITNAVRHAAASTITVRLGYEPGHVQLVIADNGRGFNPEEVLHHGLGHFGLRGLQGRSGKIGGDIRIQSQPGQGTTISVVVAFPFAAPTDQPAHATSEAS